jgi:hypothetical protein
MLPVKTFEEFAYREKRINEIQNTLSIMNSIENVIDNRSKRGANEEYIEKYKMHLINDIWRNNETIKNFIRLL